MRVKTDFKNKTCLKFLKTSFFRGKIPAFSFKKMSPDWDLIYHIMTSFSLTLFPGVLCFGHRTLQNVRIQQHYSLISEMFSNLSIVQANKNKQRRKVTRRGLYQTIND